MKTVVKTLIFTIIVPGSVTVVIPYLLLSSAAEFYLRGVRLIGLLPITLGAVFYLWCAWDFAFAGQGTPAPIDPPKRLLSRGLYGLVRNPMYVGVVLILLGEAIVFLSLTLLSYAFLVLLMFHLFVVYYEEPTLRKQFGPTYEDYCRTVPRWVPRGPRAGRTG